MTFIRNPPNDQLGPVRKMRVAEKIVEHISNQPHGATINQLSTALNRSTIHIQQEVTILRNNGSLVELPNKGRAKVYGIPNVRYENETADSEQLRESKKLRPKEFENLARDVMSNYFGTRLTEKTHSSVPKRFDHVSDDETIVGDAKYYTMVQGKFLPPAKFSTIAEHVWLLEKTGSQRKFLVFGNDRNVPTEWLKRYGRLASAVDFFFLTDKGELSHLNYRDFTTYQNTANPHTTIHRSIGSQIRSKLSSWAKSP